MDALRRSSRISRKYRIRNGNIRQQIGLEETIIKEIEQNQLTWYGHVQRIAEGRLPKIALKWMPKQKRARGRPKKNWMEGIKKAMNERNLNEGQWEERKQRSLGVGQRRKSFEPDTHTYIHNGKARNSLLSLNNQHTSMDTGQPEQRIFMETGLWAARSGFQVPVGARDFFFSKTSRTALGPTQALSQ